MFARFWFLLFAMCLEGPRINNSCHILIQAAGEVATSGDKNAGWRLHLGENRHEGRKPIRRRNLKKSNKQREKNNYNPPSKSSKKSTISSSNSSKKSIKKMKSQKKPGRFPKSSKKGKYRPYKGSRAPTNRNGFSGDQPTSSPVRQTPIPSELPSASVMPSAFPTVSDNPTMSSQPSISRKPDGGPTESPSITVGPSQSFVPSFSLAPSISSSPSGVPSHQTPQPSASLLPTAIPSALPSELINSEGPSVMPSMSGRPTAFVATSAPSQSTTQFRISGFTLEYEIPNFREPATTDLSELQSLTSAYLQNYMLGEFTSSQVILEDFLTDINSFEPIPNSVVILVGFESTAFFDPMSPIFPTEDEFIDGLVDAFSGENLSGYLGMVQALPDINLFSGSTQIFLIGSIEQVGPGPGPGPRPLRPRPLRPRPGPAEQAKETSSVHREKSSTPLITVIAVGLVLLSTLTAASAYYRRRQCRRSKASEEFIHSVMGNETTELMSSKISVPSIEDMYLDDNEEDGENCFDPTVNRACRNSSPLQGDSDQNDCRKPLEIRRNPFKEFSRETVEISFGTEEVLDDEAEIVARVLSHVDSDECSNPFDCFSMPASYGQGMEKEIPFLGQMQEFSEDQSEEDSRIGNYIDTQQDTADVENISAVSIKFQVEQSGSMLETIGEPETIDHTCVDAEVVVDEMNDGGSDKSKSNVGYSHCGESRQQADTSVAGDIPLIAVDCDRVENSQGNSDALASLPSASIDRSNDVLEEKTAGDPSGREARDASFATPSLVSERVSSSSNLQTFWQGLLASEPANRSGLQQSEFQVAHRYRDTIPFEGAPSATYLEESVSDSISIKSESTGDSIDLDRSPLRSPEDEEVSSHEEEMSTFSLEAGVLK